MASITQEVVFQGERPSGILDQGSDYCLAIIPFADQQKQQREKGRKKGEKKMETSNGEDSIFLVYRYSDKSHHRF